MPHASSVDRIGSAILSFRAAREIFLTSNERERIRCRTDRLLDNFLVN